MAFIRISVIVIGLDTDIYNYPVQRKIFENGYTIHNFFLIIHFRAILNGPGFDLQDCLDFVVIFTSLYDHKLVSSQYTHLKNSPAEVRIV
jgi:hypothetical protein